MGRFAVVIKSNVTDNVTKNKNYKNVYKEN